MKGQSMSPYAIFVEAHSGIRYLVLLVGVIAVAYAIYGVASRPAWSNLAGQIGAAFMWITRINLLIGIILWVWKLIQFGWVTLGTTFGILHPLLMFAALGVLEAMAARRGRATNDSDKWRLLLIGTGVPLILIALGVYVATMMPVM
jgi:hypothetical protein